MSIYDALASLNTPVNNKIYGVSIGIVTNNKDPEKLGRVKVKLPIRECQNETFWARMATLMGGSSKGSFFLPEVNDEVLVTFIEGDIHQPYIIGMLWNGQDKPPVGNEDGKNNIRKIKSRSGHELIFSDEAGGEKITIQSSKGHVIKMDDSSSAKIEIKDKSGNNSIVIDTNSNQVNVTGNMKINLKCGGSTIVIDGTQNSININSAMQLKIKSQMVDIEAGAMMNIKSNGMLNIKGTMVKIN